MSRGIQFRTTWNNRAMRRDFRRLRDIDQNRAAAQALNRTRTGVRTDAQRAIRTELGIKPPAPARKVRSRLMLPGGSGRATPRRLVAVGLELYKYVPKIWFFSGKRSLRAALAEGEFVATMASGYTGIFRRKEGGRGITQVLVDASDRTLRIVDRTIEEAGKTRWPKEFNRAAKRMIDRRVRR